MAGKQKKRAESDRQYPFRGLRVLDFGVGAVGVEVGRLFAEYGADVIKVEATANLDFIRAIMGGAVSPPFASSNRSKRGLGVNLKTEAGRQVVHRLIQMADVIVENSAAGVMDRIGLGYDVVRELNPRVVMVSSQLLGSSGAWSSWVGYGPSTHPVTGLSYLWNFPQDAGQPAGSQNIYPDHLVGRVGAFLAVAALIRRERSGVGGHAEVAQFEVPICLLGDLLMQESLRQGSVRPQGNSSPRGAPWGAYPCEGEDEWCIINVRSDEEWAGLRDAMGDPAWARDPEFASAIGRMRRRAEIDERLIEWTSSRANRDVMNLLQARGVPAAMIQHPRAQAEDPHLAERGYPRPLEQPPIGRVVLEGPAFRGTELPEPIITPAPQLGEHTREICIGLLNMTESEVERLIAEGALEAPRETVAKGD